MGKTARGTVRRIAARIAVALVMVVSLSWMGSTAALASAGAALRLVRRGSRAAAGAAGYREPPG